MGNSSAACRKMRQKTLYRNPGNAPAQIPPADLRTLINLAAKQHPGGPWAPEHGTDLATAISTQPSFFAADAMAPSANAYSLGIECNFSVAESPE